MLHLVLILTALNAVPPAEISADAVLPAGIEDDVLALLGVHAGGEPLPGGWILGDTAIEHDAIRFQLRRGMASITLELQRPDERHAETTPSFGLRLHDPDGVLGEGEAESLLPQLAALMRENDHGGFWVSPGGKGSIWYPNRAPTMDQRPSRLPITPTLLLQIVLLLGLLGLAAAWQPLLDALRDTERADWLRLVLIAALGLGLRLLGGVRVPGHINGHGYDLVRHMLLFPPEGHDFHGNGMYALHGLLLHLLPRGEASVVGVHLALSALTPAVLYAAARSWLHDRGPALWAALILAALPVPVFYAATEVRMVPGSFFLLLTLALAGLARHRPHPGLLLSAALLGVFTCSFQPFLLVLPAIAGLLLLATAEGRTLVRSRWFWIAAGLFLVLYAEPALHAIAGIGGAEGPAPLVRGSISQAQLALLPSFGELVEEPGNVLLNPHYTPPLIGALALLGIIVGLWRRATRWLALAIVLGALLLTVPGLVIARMNPARLQLAAQPLWALLAGAGLAAAVRWGFGGDGPPFLGSLRGRRARATAEGLLGAFLIGLVGIWSGPMARQFTPQLERRFIIEALSEIPDGCTVVWPLRERGAMPRLPTYLSAEQWRDVEWAGLPDPLLFYEIDSACVVYYRPAACYDRFDLDDEPAKRLRPECAALEAALTLEPIAEQELDAAADHTQRYSARSLKIGFYRASRPSR